MSEPPDERSLDPWAIRAFVYATAARTGRLPDVGQTTEALGLRPSVVAEAYGWLEQRHAWLLDEPGTSIRMASPFSGVPTPFAVHSNGVDYWANCAWDMLGIPAALGQDATIDAVTTEDGRAVSLAVVDGTVRCGSELVHILLPVRSWYADLVFT